MTTLARLSIEKAPITRAAGTEIRCNRRSKGDFTQPIRLSVEINFLLDPLEF